MARNRLVVAALAALAPSLLVAGCARDRQAEEDRAAEAPLEAIVAEAAGTAVVPSEVVVDFADELDEARIDAIGRDTGVHFRKASAQSARDRVYVGTADDGDATDELARLAARPDVEAADPQLFFSIPESALEGYAVRDTRDTTDAQRGPSFPNDPRYAEQWHLEQIHMPEAWKTSQGQGVIVAVIDTGVSRVEDLEGTAFVPGYNFVSDSADADDDHGHGTHVAGTIAQSTNNGKGVAGVAYKARIMPLKVLSAGGSGSVAGIAQAVRWAADHDAKVINMSLGGAVNAQVLAKAVKYAHDKGVTVVCAAGNDGRGRVSYPAANDGALAVAATQKDEKTTFYSNWGKQVAIAAPGGNTREAPSGGVLQNTRYQGKDDYYFFMGTSMAAPHVAGIAALVVGQGVTDPDAVRDVLAGSARLPAGMSDGQKPADYAQRYGAGLIDAAAAVKKSTVAHGALELGLASLFTVIAGFLLRRTKVGVLSGLGAPGLLALVVASSGLFFLPLLGLGLGGLPGASLVAHGLPAWDQALLGAVGHGNVMAYSALIPLALALLLVGARPLGGLLAGLSLGFAGHLAAQIAWRTTDVRWMTFDGAWLAANALVCAMLGVAILRLRAARR